MDDTPRSPDALDALDALDELISAALDGEATPAERARIDADPALLARLTEFEGVRTSIRAVDPPDDGEREAAIAAALEAFVVPTAAAPAAPAAPVVDLADRRRRRADRTRRLGGWLGAAAAVAVVGLVISNVGEQGSDSDSASSETVAEASAKAAEAPTDTIGAIDGGASVLAGEAGDAADSSFSAAAADTTAAAAAETTAAATDTIASGGGSVDGGVVNVSTDAEVQAYVDGLLAAERTNQSAATTVTAAPEAQPVVTVPCTLPAGVPSEVVGPLSWQGTPGILLLAPDAQAPTKAVILTADCASQLHSTDL